MDTERLAGLLRRNIEIFSTAEPPTAAKKADMAVGELPSDEQLATVFFRGQIYAYQEVLDYLEGDGSALGADRKPCRSWSELQAEVAKIKHELQELSRLTDALLG